MEAFAKARKGAQPLPNLSDEDIERAIQEIAEIRPCPERAANHPPRT
jgi:hypothetical protein